MQPPVQYNGLYTFIDMLGARDGAGAGPFHHYMLILCTAANAHQSWEVDCEL